MDHTLQDIPFECYANLYLRILRNSSIANRKLMVKKNSIRIGTPISVSVLVKNDGGMWGNTENKNIFSFDNADSVSMYICNMACVKGLWLMCFVKCLLFFSSLQRPHIVSRAYNQLTFDILTYIFICYLAAFLACNRTGRSANLRRKKEQQQQQQKRALKWVKVYLKYR